MIHINADRPGPDQHFTGLLRVDVAPIESAKAL
jgi:hypothetical protein